MKQVLLYVYATSNIFLVHAFQRFFMMRKFQMNEFVLPNYNFL